jgi:hypothetical protein
MAETITAKEYTREQIVDSVRQFSGYGSPDSLDMSNPEIAEAEAAFIAWVGQELAEAKDIGSLEAQLSTNLSISTIYADAGYANPDYLDALANDWLVQDEQDAIDAGLIEVAEMIRLKREEINAKLQLITEH